jgi:hypothetical protein
MNLSTPPVLFDDVTCLDEIAVVQVHHVIRGEAFGQGREVVDIAKDNGDLLGFSGAGGDGTSVLTAH